MTQRIFDTDNADDMALLWSILPDDATKISRMSSCADMISIEFGDVDLCSSLFRINWHDKTEITRPISEATEQDIGKLCYFWDDDEDYSKQIGLLTAIETLRGKMCYRLGNFACFDHCRRLNQKEIEELCR